MAEQFFTICKRCGKQILMTRNTENGTWVPCDPQLFRFKSGGGPTVYVTPEGKLQRGQRDRCGEYGYRHHRRFCNA